MRIVHKGHSVDVANFGTGSGGTKSVRGTIGSSDVQDTREGKSV